jgi:hypothetical protein
MSLGAEYRVLGTEYSVLCTRYWPLGTLPIDAPLPVRYLGLFRTLGMQQFDPSEAE